VDISIEERRVAIEAICTLVNIKRTMAELLLKPAGVPREIYAPLLTRRDEVTGKLLTKRQMAPLILEALEKLQDGQRIIRTIVKLASEWTSFHLADDEFAARATVQKAREIMGTVETMETRERLERESASKKELARLAEERSKIFRKECDLLLMMFDEMAQLDFDQQRRGFLLQDLLNRAFNLCEIAVQKSFQRNEGAEQIDGAFRLEGWHYLVECRWRHKLADIRELDGLLGQVGRSGKQTMGLFLSINGWSENVLKLLKQNPEKCLILMDGYDLRTSLARQLDLRAFIIAKVAKLNLEAEPFFSVSEYLKEIEGGP
jgi:hypothetical protein